LRFKVDENLPDEVAALLRAAGHDAETVIQEQMGGAVDVVVDETCRREERVLITFDKGFGNIRTHPPCERPGVILLRLRHQDTASVLAVTTRLLALLSRESVFHRLWVVDETDVRVRE
jgi:predicted nuclease of predicted toxin-antitoxin system